MEKEYAVIVKRGIDIAEVDWDMFLDTGSDTVPNRPVEVANFRPGSKRITHWWLTDEEAETLRNDERILSVEIPPDQRDDIEIGLRATQSSSFYRGFNSATDVNWGLRRTIETTNIYGNSTTAAGDYVYALTGKGVDVVIQDSGIQLGHPEWQGSDGVDRVVELDWYTASGLTGTQSSLHYRDRDGHGTHCAGIAAGKTYGFAKDAAIYSQKLEGLETLSGSDGTGIPISDAFDAIRLWHGSKTNGRPTVVNMSWGYLSTSASNPTSGEYRSTPWTYNSETDNELWDLYGIVARFGDGNRRFPAQVTFADAEVEDMIDAGIHVCIAAGNDYYKADIIGGADYNNSAVFDGSTKNYHQPGSPYSDRAYYVGNLDSAVILDNTYKDRTAASSKKGPAVNIWAPGTDIMSTTSNEADASYTVFNYPDDPTYKIMSISGTSMASPQIAGVAALYLESVSTLSPEDLLAKIVSDTESVIYQTANNDTDYRAFDTSIMGSPNRHVYSKYGVQPFSIKVI